MPTGKVRFYDADKGFGFITKDGGGDVFVRSSVLPAGVEALKTGQRVEFGVMDGRRGEQALSLSLLEAPVSLTKNLRKKPEQMAPIVEDLINLLDGISNGYQRNRHPEEKTAHNVALLLRRVADELEM